jgi:TonB family protein
VIVMPKLVHFENAPYPEQAKKAGLQAEVLLRLTIDREGSVTESVVVKPQGNGFDEAAREASLKFKFEPATRDGKPVPVRIEYRYSFTLAPAAPAAEAPEAPKTGELSGVVKIADTDTVLVGSTVIITSPDGSERRIAVDATGAWRVQDLPPGNYRVRVEAEGFQSFDSTEQVAAGDATQVTYRIAPQAEGIEFTVRGERPPREVTRRTIERREIERIPGTSGDALRSLQSLPGVARPPGLAGLLIVRGSSPNGTNVFVDGSLVPIVYHFGGLSSVVPTELLERIDFYPGNFSARYGRVSGGVVDVGLRAPETRCYDDYGKKSERQGCYHGMIQADLIDTRLLVQGPLGPIKGWSFAVAGRRSWIDAWLKPVLEEAGSSVTSAPVYYDYQLIAERKTADSKLSFRAFGSDDRFEIIVTDPSAQDPAFGGNVNLGTSFYRVQGLYEAELSRTVSLRSMLSAGKDTVDFGLGNLAFQLDAYPIYWRHEIGVQLAEGMKFNAGLDFWVGPYDVFVRAPEPPRPGEPSAGPFATRPIRETRVSGRAFRPAWYAELEMQPIKRLRVVPGIRLDHAVDSGHSDLSPRLMARYDLLPGGEGKLRTTIKGGIGRFNQPPEFQETDKVFGTPNLKSNQSIHYALGAEQEFTRQIELSVEGFYKDLSQQVSRAPAANGRFTYNNVGLGYVVGVETLLKYKPDDRFFGWVAYTLSRSVRQESPSDDEYLFQYDQTHNLIMLGSYRLGRGWEFGARFRVVSGPLDTPVQRFPGLPAIYAADAGAYTPVEGKAYSRRLPLFHQMDLRVDKLWQFKDWRFSTYLDVQNVYNNAAVEQLVYNYNFSKDQYQTGIPIVPSIGVRGEF